MGLPEMFSISGKVFLDFRMFKNGYIELAILKTFI